MTSRHAVAKRVLRTNKKTIAFNNEVMNDPLHEVQLQDYLVKKQMGVDSIDED